jgi:15-cis-phytoene synthase
VNTTLELAEAYRHCEAVTRTQAANFYYGIRLLERDRRQAMCAVYAFARRVDDIGDGELEPRRKLSRLDAEEAALSALDPRSGPARTGEDAVFVALADARLRFALPDDALAALIEGVRMDVAGVSYERFEELVPYCRRVAGAIGRVCLAIFGMRTGARPDRAESEALADDLGVALQLTNILRDLREDAGNGRVYLPAEDLRRFGVLTGEGQGAAELGEAIGRALAGGPGDAGGEELERLSRLVRFEAARAREWFARGLTLTSRLDRRSGACVAAMAGIYSRVLDRIERDPEQALKGRISLPAHEKAWVAARVLLGGDG